MNDEETYSYLNCHTKKPQYWVRKTHHRHFQFLQRVMYKVTMVWYYIGYVFRVTNVHMSDDDADMMRWGRNSGQRNIMH
jgi:hypothetical protein